LLQWVLNKELLKNVVNFLDVKGHILLHVRISQTMAMHVCGYS